MRDCDQMFPSKRLLHFLLYFLYPLADKYAIDSFDNVICLGLELTRNGSDHKMHTP